MVSVESLIGGGDYRIKCLKLSFQKSDAGFDPRNGCPS